MRAGSRSSIAHSSRTPIAIRPRVVGMSWVGVDPFREEYRGHLLDQHHCGDSDGLTLAVEVEPVDD